VPEAGRDAPVVSVDLRLPFGRFLRLAMVEYLKECGGRECVSAAMTEDFIDRSLDEWNRARKPKKERSVFVPPTPEEVTAYSIEIKWPLDGIAFCLHYEVKAWHTGGNAKMKNWKAAVRNWKRNEWKTKSAPRIAGVVTSLPEPEEWRGRVHAEYAENSLLYSYADNTPWEKIPRYAQENIVAFMKRFKQENRLL